MFNNQKGSALLWVLGAASIIAVISAALPQFFSSNEQDFKINYAKNSISIVKESLIAMLDNDAVWAETLNRNPSMACLKTAGMTCAAGPQAGINIYDADGSVYLSSAAISGFTFSGEPCNQFNAVIGHATCVLKFNLSWECNGPCVPTEFNGGVLIANKPGLKLKASFIFSPLQIKLKNLIDKQSTAYTFDFIRGSQSKTLSSYCNSVSGIFNQQTQTCAASNAEPGTFDCTTLMGPHAFFIGFNLDGTPKCMNSINLNNNCPAGMAIIGYQSDGSIACGTF